MTIRSSLFLLGAAGLRTACGLELNVDNKASIRAAASTIAHDLLGYYQNAESTTPSQVGLFPFEPYYWWESGGAWGGIVNYWAYTGDDQYVELTMDAIAAQVGPNYDFIMPQQVKNEANDDQAFWVFTALAAMEFGFPRLDCPDGSKTPGCKTDYEVLATNAYHHMVMRWGIDSQYCAGGLRWQYTPSQDGYDYKSTIANGGFFQIAARLARYTGNSSFADWAERVYSWCEDVGFLEPNGIIYDGAHLFTNCTDIEKLQWSYNYGTFLYGAAMMYDFSNGDMKWRTRIERLFAAASANFFKNGVIFEASCEALGTCKTDQLSYKGFLARFMAKSVHLAPFLGERVHKLMVSSAKAAAQSCSGGTDGHTCGTKWYVSGWDKEYGLGQQMNALETVLTLLAPAVPPKKKNGSSAQPPSSKAPPPASNPKKNKSTNSEKFPVSNPKRKIAKVLDDHNTS